MANKIYFIFIVFLEVYSLIKIYFSFDNGLNRFLGFFLCLLFVQIIRIIWMQYLILQPEEIQREVKFTILEDTAKEYSLYDILQFKSFLKKVQFLHTEIFFTMFFCIITSWMFFLEIRNDSNFDIIVTFKNVLTASLLPYYLGFCFNIIVVFARIFIRDKKYLIDDIQGILMGEIIVKIINTLLAVMPFSPVTLLFFIAIAVLKNFKTLKLSKETIQKLENP